MDELLKDTPEGKTLFASISPSGRNWNEIEEIWLTLSMRFASVASGIVHCFSPDRLSRTEGVQNFEHPYTQGAYANTQFEKEPNTLQQRTRYTNLVEWEVVLGSEKALHPISVSGSSGQG